MNTMGLCGNHNALYFDALCRTKKSETVLSLIYATYLAEGATSDQRKALIASRLVDAYKTLKGTAGSYTGDLGQFSSQYTIGHEMGIWKNSKLELTDMAIAVADNRITIREYFDRAFLNYIQPVNNKIVHLLYHLLIYMDQNNLDSINKVQMAQAFRNASGASDDGEINGAFNMLIGSNYFEVLNQSTLKYSGKVSIKELISSCNTKYVDEGYEKAKEDLDTQEKYATYLLSSKDISNAINVLVDNDVQKKCSNPVAPTFDKTDFDTQDYSYMSAIKTKPFLILGGFSGTGKSLCVKLLAFATCPCDGILNLSETTPGNYLLVSVKPNWHDATDITGFRSSVNSNYYVTDFLRFLVKAKKYENKKVPFFVCLDEMNLAPVEEYFADFLSVIESRKRKNDGRIVTDPIVSASVFNAKDYAADFNIFLSLGLTPTKEFNDITDFTEEIKKHGNESDFFEESWLVDELKQEGLTIPSNVVIVGTVNMDDTTNSFSRKVIDRAMTFETVVGEFDDSYFDSDVALNYVKNPFKGELFISDEVRATEMLDAERFSLDDKNKKDIIGFINNINNDLEGSPFKVSYRILNETILLYRSKLEIEKIINDDGGFENDVEFNTDLNSIFDEILMQKVLPRIEGDYEKCNKCLHALFTRAKSSGWTKSEEKIDFMIKRFGSDLSGFTSFWN